GTADYMADNGMIYVPFFLILTIIIQLGCGGAMIVGYKTKATAFLLAGLTLIINLVIHDFWTLPAGELQTAHETQNFVKNLGINSFVMTDADGKIIASSDDKKVGTNFLDDETTKQFKANLKGMKVKSISEPTAVEGEDGVYNLMACVARTEGGIVIIDTNTSDYSAVIGADIAKSCKGDTIIVKNGEVVSTNMNLGDNGLKSAGITDEMIRSENFNVTIDGTTYSLSSMPSGEYTIISGQAATESGFNMIYGVVIPCAAGVVMIIISGIILSLGTTKKKENE
ncbi:MAG: DoxX family membrane protein, partial [Ruminococcus bromii]